MTKKNIHLNVPHSVKTKNDFIQLVSWLALDIKDNADEWENKNLPDYFEAMAAWVEDMDGYYKNCEKSVPEDINWRVFADILMAAKVYE
ncbi:hypothetical protein JHU04_001103 [Brenneria sp. 4F2]|nr:hypothetical protein [Brenneria bubanii]